ncbi:phosphoribosyltransferase [Candidatus Microgenomates bacterium]|jgi:putative phosphoribosyl transferase|nr:MAG: phosphoribosyltransferase [Candidatus Microgenomates bacterium]
MFKDRTQAGKKLVEKLKEDTPFFDPEKTVVLAIPKGGVLVGREISQAFSLPLEAFITKKVPSPQSEDLAIGAVGEGGVVVWEEKLCEELRVSAEYKQDIVKKKIEELGKKAKDFKADGRELELLGKTVILADDGIATGETMKVAIKVLKAYSPKEIIIAVPVIAPDLLSEIKNIADKIIYLEAPEMFFSVDQFYENFNQPSDQEVCGFL